MRFKSVVKVTQNCRNWRMLSISVAELDSSVAEFALSDVGTFEKDRKNVDAEETPKDCLYIPASNIEKGNPDTTLTTVDIDYGKKLGLEDLNSAIESTKHMYVDDPKTGVEKTVDDSVQLSPEKDDD